ncbi:MAG: hemolysin family protein [Spirochaetaceae bacterium]|nr:hemolysin family protein [Spirochaetaceae bacterium]
MGFFKKEKKEDLMEEQLDEEELAMLEGIITLDETTAKEVMVPRVDTIFVSESDNFEQVLAKAQMSGHSRYPVYKETIDNVTGILYIKELLGYLKNAENFNVPAVMRKPFFVPESKKLDSLLSDFKKKHVHIAVVIDEYGGVSGILCMEDIIERIIGDIQDEFDDEEEAIIKLGDNEYLCDGRLNVDEVNEELALNLPNEDIDTLGGFVFNLLGTVPNLYQKVSYNNSDFIVERLDGHIIRSIKVVMHEDKVEN